MTEPQSDQDLMQRLKGGENAALTELYHRHYRRVLNIVWRYLGRESEAEDLAQEVFIRVARSASRWEPKAAFTTWLYQITGNLCLNFRRNRARRGKILKLTSGQPDETGQFDPVAQAEDTSSEPSGGSLIRDEVAREVRAALDQLPERQRLAIVLLHYEQLGHAEIGEALGISANAAKQICHRARENLRELLASKASRLMDE